MTGAAGASVLDDARDALAEGRYDQAEKLLDSLDPARVDGKDLDFLLGTLAMDRGRYDQAIGHFRALLDRDPSLNRVRLDLARCYFLAGDDEAALYHFRIAEAAGLPPAVQANVDRYLAEILRRKRWSLDVSFGIAPDTNINAATVVKTVNLFGQPFQLDQNAQKKSGVGFIGDLGGAYQFPLSDDTRLVGGGAVDDTDYEGRNFDDRSVTVFAGSKFLVGDQSAVTVKAETSRRWYGGLPYSAGGGVRIEAETALSPRWLVNGAFDLQRITYDQQPYLTGPVASLSGAVIYGLDSQSFLRGETGILREQAAFASFRDTQYIVGLAYYSDLPHGFGATLGVNADLARYDALLAAFGAVRRDTSMTYRLAVTNHALDFQGFTPSLALIHVDRTSTIDFYAFNRDRAEITLARSF